jgi:hypothetical protein
VRFVIKLRRIDRAANANAKLVDATQDTYAE